MTRLLGYAFAAVTFLIATAMIALQVAILWALLPHSPVIAVLIVLAVSFEIWAYKFDEKYS